MLSLTDKVYLHQLFETLMSGAYKPGLKTLSDFTTLKRMSVELDFKDEIARLILMNKTEVKDKIIAAVGNNGFEFAQFVKEICDVNPAINEHVRKLFACVGVV